MWGQGEVGPAAARQECCPLPWQSWGHPGQAGVSALRFLPADTRLRSAHRAAQAAEEPQEEVGIPSLPLSLSKLPLRHHHLCSELGC